MRKSRILVCQGFNDNSTAVEGFGEEAAAVFNQKKQEELLDNINVVVCGINKSRGAIVCYFKYEFIQ
jgi:hypothetical protein